MSVWVVLSCGVCAMSAVVYAIELLLLGVEAALALLMVDSVEVTAVSVCGVDVTATVVVLVDPILINFSVIKTVK